MLRHGLHGKRSIGPCPAVVSARKYLCVCVCVYVRVYVRVRVCARACVCARMCVRVPNPAHRRAGRWVWGAGAGAGASVTGPCRYRTQRPLEMPRRPPRNDVVLVCVRVCVCVCVRTHRGHPRNDAVSVCGWREWSYGNLCDLM